MTVTTNIMKAQKRAAEVRAEKKARGEQTAAKRLKPEGFDGLKSSWSIPLEEFCRRAGLGPTALRRAQRAGLVVTPVGANRFVRQADWEAYLSLQAEAVRKRQSETG